MNGNQEFSQEDTKIKLANDFLDKFELDNQLPRINNQNGEDVEKILNMPYLEINKVTLQQAREYSIVLSAYAAYIQKLSNIAQSELLVAEENINRIISKRLGQQKAYSYEERRICAIQEDEQAKKYQMEKYKASLKIQRLNFMSKRLEHLSDKYSELSKSMR